MIILYGSYARNTYVDCDRRRDYGVTTFFMSDYDILIEGIRRLRPHHRTVFRKQTKRILHPAAIHQRKYFPAE